MAKEKQENEDSALKNIVRAGAKGAASPSLGAKISGEILSPPGAGEAAAQGLQAVANMGAQFSKDLMTGIIRQHGRGPSAVLQDLKIKQAINAKKTTKDKGQSTNQGIKSYQNKLSGQLTNPSRGSSSSKGQGR
jgi:hypothetical protein